MERKAWNTHVATYAPAFGGFLQMWEWGESQLGLGFPVVRIAEHTPSGFVLAQGIWQPLPLGASYWFFPKGPLGDASEEDMRRALFVRAQQAAFCKIEPVQAPIHAKKSADRQPAHTRMLDLQQGSEMVFSQMKQKTRYNIRLAQKKGVVVELTGIEGLDRFMALMRITATRDGFSAHTKERYAATLRACVTEDVHAYLAFATYNGEDIAANMMIDALGVRTYLHGASASVHRDVMAPYALHGYLIEDACAQGMRAYDFWGVAPEHAQEGHPWVGISRFKAGFGGSFFESVGTFDLVKSPLRYGLYQTAKRFR